MTDAVNAGLPRGVRRILVVESGPIDPETNAGDRACADLLDGLTAIGAEVRYHGLGARGLVDARLLSGMRARNSEITFSIGETDLNALLEAERFDAVIVGRPGAALLCGPALVAHPELVRVFWGHDIHSRRLAAQDAVRGDAGDRRSSLMSIAEATSWQTFDLSVYPAAHEAEAVDEVAPGKGVASSYYRLADADLAARSIEAIPEHRHRRGILMVGSSLHAPNVDAVEWAIEEVLPLIRIDHPDASLTIVGAWSPTQRRKLDRLGVRFTGVVTDDELRRLHHKHICLLAPLRFGGGTKRKVVAAMGLGLPVVTTDEGQRGVLVRDGEGQSDGICIGNDPWSLASAVTRLHTDDGFWSRMSTASSAAVEMVYESRSYDRALIDILNDGVAKRDHRMRSQQETHGDPAPPSP